SIREGTQTSVSIIGGNQGKTLTTSIDPSNNPAEFGPPGSVLFRDPSFPAKVISPTPVYPIPITANTSINEFDPNLRPAYVQSWNVSFQREIAKDMVLDIRYVGNHGTRLWRQGNINEVNIFENGFLQDLIHARNNLTIAASHPAQ